MRRFRPQHQLDRVQLDAARDYHRANRPLGCECITCIGIEEFDRRIRAKVAAQTEVIGEPPF